jgi:protein phosphatase
MTLRACFFFRSPPHFGGTMKGGRMWNVFLVATASIVLIGVGYLMWREMRWGSQSKPSPKPASSSRRPESSKSKPSTEGSKSKPSKEESKSTSGTDAVPALHDQDVAGDDCDITTLAPGHASLPDVDDEEGPTAASASKAATYFADDAQTDEPAGSYKLITVWAAGQTDKGRRRSRNEDAILLLPDSNVFAIADGMGGYAAGDVASHLAVETIERLFRSGELASTPPQTDRPQLANELVSAIEAANRAIRDEARRDPALRGMGATFVSARFSEHRQRAFICHVGDCRCYRHRGGSLQLLTKDHTLAAHGVAGPMASRIRRALGVIECVAVDVYVDKPRADDVYLLCSDGLNKMVSDERICDILTANREDLDHSVQELIGLANESGGKDNVSVVLIGIQSPD